MIRSGSGARIGVLEGDMNTNTTAEPEAPERDARAEMRAGLLADGWTPERLAAKRAAYRQLQDRHARMYAAVREKWEGDSLVEPYLLAVAPDYPQLRAKLAAIPVHQLEGASICYVTPAGVAMGY